LGGVDPVNNIILYYNIVYYIHIHSLWFSNTYCVVKISISIWCCCPRQWSLWRHDNTFNDARHSDVSSFPPPKIGSSDSLHILHWVCYGWPPKMLKFSWKS